MLDMVRSMMEFATRSISFWRYALETICLVLNNISSKSVSRHHMRYSQDVGRTSLTLGSRDVQLMLNDYKLTSSVLSSISVIS